MRGADPPQRGYRGPPPAAAPPRAAQAPRGCAGAVPRPRPVGSVPQPTWGLLVASHLPQQPSPPQGHLLPPQAKPLAVSRRRRGRPPRQEHRRPGSQHQRHRLPSRSPELGSRWDGQGKRVTRPCSALTPLAKAGGEGSQGNDPVPGTPKPSARHRRDRGCFLGGRRKRWEVGVGGRSPWGAAAGSWVTARGGKRRYGTGEERPNTP